MNKLFFTSDYQEGAHPKILENLVSTNFETAPGYGVDQFCDKAKDSIRKVCDAPNAGVYFLVGGTQTNSTVIDALLTSYQGVISATSGHINVHEAGAVELFSHKVMELPHTDGKLNASDIHTYCANYWGDANREHMVMPAMVYLSQPTEYGTMYSLDELTAIREVCDEFKLKLFVDGARLAYSLATEDNTITLPDLARLCDVFYIGGTKCGMLCGEAVVLPDPELIPNFTTIIKQHGALLEKGRLLGIQFETMFGDGLYFEVGKTAIDGANRIREILTEKGYTLAYPNPTNQVFFLLEHSQMEPLAEKVDYGYMEEFDENHSVVRFATSWATKMEDIEKLAEIL